MDIQNNIKQFHDYLTPNSCRLVAVSKTKPVSLIMEAYNAGQRVFGENKVQELTEKSTQLPEDIEWHMIGHLQRNKVKYIAPFVSLIHSVDSLKLLKEIDKQAKKAGRVINCLLQIHIAREETKFGLSEDELAELMHGSELKELTNVRIVGMMGMATNTDDLTQVRSEFSGLKELFDRTSSVDLPANVQMKELSIGMSGDYKIAVEEGSTLVRIGTAVFGARNKVA